ncbi:MAG: hypothetical protein ACFB9N_03485 [Geitlerinemataceae cyanobacterium]
MAHASHSWQQTLLYTLERILLPRAEARGNKGGRKYRTRSRDLKQAVFASGGWWLALAFALVLMMWHPTLLLAVLAGAGTMAGVYMAATSGKKIDWVAVSRLGDRLRQPVLLAIGSGAAVSLLVYLSVAIWNSTANHWMASGFIAQGVATLAVLVLLVWQTLVRLTGRDRVELTPILLQIADENELKRAIAIQQIGQWIEQRRLDRAERKSVSACLQYLLTRETDEAIRDAALDVLGAIQLQDGKHYALGAASGNALGIHFARKQVDRVSR